MKQPLVQDILLRSGVVDTAGLTRALEVQSSDGRSLGWIFADLGLSTEDTVAAAIAKGLALEDVSLDEADPPPESDRSLPAEFCRQRKVVPLGTRGRSLRLAIIKNLKRIDPDLNGTGMQYDLIPTVNPEGEDEATREEDHEVVHARVSAILARRADAGRGACA